jgi:Kef-type K+ transport system membrane component KefB
MLTILMHVSDKTCTRGIITTI